jgi:hypothetical protein
MNDPKPDDLRQDSVDVGCGMVLFGKRWLVEEMTYQSHKDLEGIDLTIRLTPWESIDPTLYRLKPKRRRKKKGEQP